MYRALVSGAPRGVPMSSRHAQRALWSAPSLQRRWHSDDFRTPTPVAPKVELPKFEVPHIEAPKTASLLERPMAQPEPAPSIASPSTKAVGGAGTSGYSPTIEKVLASLHDTRRTRYESIDPDAKIPGLTLDDSGGVPERDGTMVHHTTVYAPGGQHGHVTRAFNAKTGTMELREAFLDKIPPEYRTVEHNGEDMRLHDFLTHRQARQAGVEYGGLKKVKMSTIQNVGTVAGLEAAKRKGAEPGEAFRSTPSFNYAARFLKDMGHEVGPATITGGRKTPFDEMLGHYERQGMPGGRRNPDRAAKYDEILKKAGVGRHDKVHWDFDVAMGLSPDESAQ